MLDKNDKKDRQRKTQLTAKIVLLIVAIGLSPVAQASACSILLGTRTLDLADDLTVLQDESGHIWEWLDLTSTIGMSIADALARYESSGFHWATGAEVAALYATFGIPYAIVPNFYAVLDRVDRQAEMLQYLGITYYDGDPFLNNYGSFGWIDDLASDTMQTFSCVSRGGGACFVVSGYVRNYASAPTAFATFGTYLVRHAPSSHSVPEPSTLLLVGAAVTALGAARRRAGRTGYSVPVPTNMTGEITGCL